VGEKEAENDEVAPVSRGLIVQLQFAPQRRHMRGEVRKEIVMTGGDNYFEGRLEKSRAEERGVHR
jgi:hypothetical protein